MKNKLINTSKKDTTWIEEAKERKKNEAWLELSFSIALRILRYLRKEGLSQKKLAETMNCSPQYLNKILKGKENLTLETICKMQKATGLVLIEVPYAEIRAKQKSYDLLENVNNESNVALLEYDISQHKMTSIELENVSESMDDIIFSGNDNRRFTMAA